jgi:hypothetical protein
MTTQLGVIEGGADDSAAPAPPSPAVLPSPKKYRATIYPPGEIDADFGALIAELEKLLGYQVWVLVQGTNEQNPWDNVSSTVYHGFRSKKAEIPDGQQIGLLIDSPGGQAKSAYEIVRLFQRRTTRLTTIVPIYAKSAATLIAIGGREIDGHGCRNRSA